MRHFKKKNQKNNNNNTYKHELKSFLKKSQCSFYYSSQRENKIIKSMLPTPSSSYHQHQHQNNDYNTNSSPVIAVDTVVIGLPRGFSSWFQLPANPLIGQKGIAVEGRTRSDYAFFCDACEKGFMAEELYQRHVQDHLYCEVPGCKFTCRKDKAWKMDMHVETLHCRVDAPNLADGKKYIEDRRRKFPTKDVVEVKTEELMLKASRGEILPDERRRWLRRYGVIVRRDGQGIVMVGDSSNNRSEAAKTEPLSAQDEEAAKKKIQQDKEARERREARLRKVAIALMTQQTNSDSNYQQKQQQQIQAKQQPQNGDDDNNNNKNKSFSNSHHKTIALSESSRHVIPMGAHGRLTKSQQVQLIRDRYRAATRVPNFYVCNRCGLKGVHWIEDCPKTLEIQANAKERRLRRERQEEEGKEETESSSAVAAGEKEDEEGDDEEVDQDSAEIKNLKIPDIQLDDLPKIDGDKDEFSDSESESSDSSSTNSSQDDDDDEDISKTKNAEVPLPLPKGTRIESTSSILGTTITTVRNDDDSNDKRNQDRPLTDEEEIQRRRLVARRRLRAQMRVEAQQRHSAAPSLLDRMMEDSKLASSGLLLQAMRFFVVNNFFIDDNDQDQEEQEEETHEEGEVRKE
jgi:hypothetical protein